MSAADNDVVITGIGVVTSLGVGRQVHADLIAGNAPLVAAVDRDWLPPYAVHPMPAIDWGQQIPRRGDQRQMENWQRLGVFSAGLALDDAGLKDNAEACATMDMIVAAGGGERDIAVDSLIVEEGRKRNDRDVLLNEKLTTELRPTLFLAQLSNLLAGNISIVHKVTGSSRTFMGEEGAGISAIETAFARIAAGQSTHCLVGGAVVAERPDQLLQIEMNGYLASDANPDGVDIGSAGAFLVLESRAHAVARGAHIYARIDEVAGDRGGRDAEALSRRLGRLADTVAPDPAAVPLVITAATKLPVIGAGERDFLKSRFPDAVRREIQDAFGHNVEAQFPLGLALAAIAVSSGKPAAPFSSSEPAMPRPARSALVTSVGIQRAEGMARISAEA